MKKQLSNAFNSLWGGLMTGMVIGAAALVPTLVNAQAESTVKASAQSELKGQSNKWADNTAAKPGDSLKYIINYQNVGSAGQESVVIRAALPKELAIVPGTTMVYNESNKSGAKPDTDTLTSEQGIAIGKYGPGANAYVTFEATVAAADKLACGDNQIKMTGSVQPKDVAKTDVSAGVTVKRDCSAAATTPSTTQKPKSTTPTTPASDPSKGTATTPQATTPAPAATPATPASNTALPNTGAGDVVAIFAVAAVAGFFGHKLLMRRFAN